MFFKNMITKEEFKKLYIDELLTYKEIGEKYGVSSKAVESANNKHFNIRRTNEQKLAARKKHFVHVPHSKETYALIKEKREKTMLEKYGAKNASNIKEFQEKRKNVFIEKYRC